MVFQTARPNLDTIAVGRWVPFARVNRISHGVYVPLLLLPLECERSQSHREDPCCAFPRGGTTQISLFTECCHRCPDRFLPSLELIIVASYAS